MFHLICQEAKARYVYSSHNSEEGSPVGLPLQFMRYARLLAGMARH
jgi:hypothetical protein